MGRKFAKVKEELIMTPQMLIIAYENVHVYKNFFQTLKQIITLMLSRSLQRLFLTNPL